MTSANTHTDTQNDTGELDAQVELQDAMAQAIYSVNYDELKPGQDERVDYHVRVIAQREQAAELRGRIDELVKVKANYLSKTEPAYRSISMKVKRLRRQATKPEKGGLER